MFAKCVILAGPVSFFGCVAWAGSHKDLIHHMTFHIGESEIAAALVEGEAFVVEAEQM